MTIAPPGLPEKHDGRLGDSSDAAADVRLWLRLLSLTMGIEARLRRRLAAHGTTLPRFDVLAALDRRGPLTMGELSRTLLVSNGNVTAIVRALAADGHVETAPGPDRRVVTVTMTAAGSSHFATLAADHHGLIASLFSGLGAADRTRLYVLLGALKAEIAATPEDA